jgi:hypothetical protein
VRARTSEARKLASSTTTNAECAHTREAALQSARTRDDDALGCVGDASKEQTSVSTARASGSRSGPHARLVQLVVSEARVVEAIRRTARVAAVRRHCEPARRSARPGRTARVTRKRRMPFACRSAAGARVRRAAGGNGRSKRGRGPARKTATTTGCGRSRGGDTFLIFVAVFPPRRQDRKRHDIHPVNNRRQDGARSKRVA